MPNLQYFLENINRSIKLKPEEKKNYMKYLKTITQLIIKKMKTKDKAFKQLYNGHYIQGSYFDNLKITKPDEYDIIIELKLPMLQFVKIKADTNKPGYVKINISKLMNKLSRNTLNRQYALYHRLERCIDSNGFLSQKEISNWFESIMERIKLKRKKFGNKYYTISYNKSGPAQTINVIVSKLYNKKTAMFAVDYVPGFIFNKTHWIAPKINKNYVKKTKWMAIPKPDKKVNCTSHELNISFKSSFTSAERYIISNKNGLKANIRLLKKLRDTQNIQNLKSYFIKTVFMWENELSGPELWNKSSEFVFMYMFKKLIHYIEKGNLPFFWNPNQNMLQDLNDNQIKTMANQLKAAYEKVENYKFVNVYKVFLTEDEIYKAQLQTK